VEGNYLPYWAKHLPIQVDNRDNLPFANQFLKTNSLGVLVVLGKQLIAVNLSLFLIPL
jgi:hypothetical protein